MLVGNERVTRDRLLTLLAEAAGRRVLEEVALDRAIERELQDRGLEVDEDAAERERRALLGVLAAEIGLDPRNVAETEARVRSVRGLGPARWAALLRRSASLRALVADEVDTSDAAVRLAHAERRAGVSVARLIETASQREAARLAEEINTAADPRAAFLERAVDASASPSRGVLVTLRSVDPLVPAAVRAAAAGLEPGSMSGVIATARGYAIVWLERKEPGDTRRFEELSPEEIEDVRASVRLRQESVLMGRLAARLLGGTRVTAFDPSLAWAWAQGERPDTGDGAAAEQRGR